MKHLIGKKIKKIFMGEDDLFFQTDVDEFFHYQVYGDCCSKSYFHDFIGVKKLLNNGGVTAVKEEEIVNESKGCKCENCTYDLQIDVYGYSITTESEEFGEQTSVFSFRNASNGYYGGSLAFRGNNPPEKTPELLDDFITS